MRALHYLPLSPYCRKVRLVLAEKRLPFDLRLEKVWERRDDYLLMNPAATVPTLLDDNEMVVPDSSVICEYLEEAYQDTPLMGVSLKERVEVRRLVAWFDGKFAVEVTENLTGQKYLKRLAGRGHPDAIALRVGYAQLKEHLPYLGWLAETRKWLAGSAISLADFAAAAHLSVLDFTGDVDWTISPPAREWYARMKSRPSFRPLLSDRVPGHRPADALRRPRFLTAPMGGRAVRTVLLSALALAGCAVASQPPPRPAVQAAPLDWFQQQVADARRARQTHMPKDDRAGRAGRLRPGPARRLRPRRPVGAGKVPAALRGVAAACPAGRRGPAVLRRGFRRPGHPASLQRLGWLGRSAGMAVLRAGLWRGPAISRYTAACCD